MEKKFSSNLSRLRKEKRMSQKDAAAGLGVSQALLSHYENGIRECGLEFILKAADFYNVSTDYLLGRSESKQGFTGDFSIEEDIESDSTMCTLTIFRAASRLRECLAAHTAEDFVDEIHNMYGLIVYRIIISEVAKGNFPRSWLPNVDVVNSNVYKNIMDGLEHHLINERNTLGTVKEDSPLCVKTIVEHMQKYVYEQCKSSGVILSDECLTCEE